MSINSNSYVSTFSSKEWRSHMFPALSSAPTKKHTNTHTHTHLFGYIWRIEFFGNVNFILEGLKLRSHASDLIHQMSLLIHDVTLRLFLFDSPTMTLVGNDSHFTSRFSFDNPTTSWNESSQHQPSSVKRHNHYGQPLVDHCTPGKNGGWFRRSFLLNPGTFSGVNSLLNIRRAIHFTELSWGSMAKRRRNNTNKVNPGYWYPNRYLIFVRPIGYSIYTCR